MSSPKDSLRTHRFRTYALGLGALVALAVLALVLGADSTLVGVVLGAPMTLTMAALGLGSWHDRGVRETLARALLTPSPSDPATTGAPASTPSTSSAGAAPEVRP